MKPIEKILLLTTFIFLSYCYVFADEMNSDRSLSPYFIIKSTSGTTESLPLLKTSAEVKISGVIADVTVTQIYHNTGTMPIEAVYVFPASINAAVYGMTMKIAERLLVAEIKEKEKAKEIYEKAKREGKSASLLEQKRPNVFRMNVANIMPGDTIIVTLQYTELIEADGGIYEFSYPTVVGPRYVNDITPDAEVFSNIPYGKEGEMPYYEFDLSVDLNAGMPLDFIECNTHKMKFKKESETRAKLVLDDTEKHGGNRDFILKYRLSGGTIQTGLLLNKGETENFFLLMLQPPKKVEDEMMPPREFIFILDISGSMNGFPLDVSKSLIFNLLDNLKEVDKFNIILFAGGSRIVFNKTMPVNKENIRQAKMIIASEQGGGGTELLPALKSALDIPKDSEYSRIIAILTDGYVGVEKETYSLISENLNNSNIFAFGIGSSVNRYLIEMIARAGNGKSFVVTKPSEANDKAKEFTKYISTPVMSNIEVDYQDFNVYDVEPSSIPDVFSERPILVFGKWQYPAEGTITVSGFYNKKKYKVDIPLSEFATIEFATIESNKALTYLWARKRLSVLSDFNTLSNEESNKGLITDLGLKYNLLTNYTSFVAVDYEIRNDGQIYQSIQQPVPLPEGVSEFALSRNVAGGSFYGGMGGACPLGPSEIGTKIFAGLRLNYHDYKISALPLIKNIYVPNETISDFNLLGFDIGITYEHHLGKRIEESISSLIFSLNYSSASGQFEKSFDNYILKTLTDTLPVPAKYTGDINFSYLNFECLFKQNLSNYIPLGIALGLSGGVLLDSYSNEKFSLITQDTSIYFPKDQKTLFAGKTLLLNDGDKDNFNIFNLEFLLNVQYEIIIGEGYYITPWIGYRWNLFSIINKANTKYSDFNIGVAIRFAI